MFVVALTRKIDSTPTSPGGPRWVVDRTRLRRVLAVVVAASIGAVALSGGVARADSRQWSIVSSPNSNTSDGAELYAVSCASRSLCMAVGGGLIEEWDGSSLTQISSPNSSSYGSVLTGVNCVSADFCVAVGYYQYNSNYSTEPLIEEWNGSRWSLVSSPNTGSLNNYLFGVSCVTSNFCIAVGVAGAAPLVEEWNGSRWSLVNSPSTSGQLYSVSCASSSFCMAAGDVYYHLNGTHVQTLIEEWDGSSWKLVSSPNGSSQDSVLNAVSCVSTDFCLAAGCSSFCAPPGFIYYVSFDAQTLTEEWDGSTWNLVNSPPSSPASGLFGVNCISSRFCMAVGADTYQTLTEEWDGISWRLVSSPNSPSGGGDFFGVSCVSRSFCLSVGSYEESALESVYVTLAARWSGNDWSRVSSASSFITTGNFLSAVSCTSVSFCMAAGVYYGEPWHQMLIEEWDGSSWSLVVGSPSGGGTEEQILNGVSCSSANFCMAAGYDFGDHGSGYDYRTLIEEWNGSSWSQVSSPTSGYFPDLYGVSCVSSSFCMATGSQSNGYDAQTLTEEWNGRNWSLVSSPGSGTSPELQGVSCVSSNFCMASGDYHGGTNKQTLIEEWNGSSWKLVSSPNSSSTQDNVLNSVSCISSDSCIAAGRYHNGTNDQTLIEDWDGSSWHLVTSPDSNTMQNVLQGVSCTSKSFCMAAGGYDDGTNFRTLIERR
jgi:hypothetical protein